ncbi:uncharacterized protein L201_007623 [Kwoniella dendrophila CBS 6074]|uniref:Altered inheritance of mitochondria protein 6 n=1 Tax=Kwoniella dendrophila CBS 6074 TaxID=1295534 RepID=A0AAX4K6A5_9TREE
MKPRSTSDPELPLSVSSITNFQDLVEVNHKDDHINEAQISDIFSSESAGTSRGAKAIMGIRHYFETHLRRPKNHSNNENNGKNNDDSQGIISSSSLESQTLNNNQSYLINHPIRLRPGHVRLNSSSPLLLSTRNNNRKYQLSLKNIIKWLFIFIISTSIIIIAILLILIASDKDTVKSGKCITYPNGSMHDGSTSTHGPLKWLEANSHNDEMQGVNAFQLALSLGYGCIEVDTYLGKAPNSITHNTTQNTISPPPPSPSSSSSSSLLSSPAQVYQSAIELDPSLTLLAGHDLKDLKSQRTLKQYYFDPLMDILNKHNANRNITEEGWIGIYEDDPDKQVGIYIDMKRDGEAIWPYLVDLLIPFMDKGYLTYYDIESKKWFNGPLMIIGTGETPINKVYYSYPKRYIFYDAPLLILDKPFIIPKTSDGPSIRIENGWSKEISPVSSSKLPLKFYLTIFYTNLNHSINSTSTSTSRSGSKSKKGNNLICQLKQIHYIARQKGIKSRWWGIIGKPNFIKVKLWKLLFFTGQDILNTDDLLQSRIWLDSRFNQIRNLDKC